MENLGELCNFQYTIILCEIFELCATHLNKILNSTLANTILTAPMAGVFIKTKVNVLPHFQPMQKQLNFVKKTFIGGFSGVNTRITFDSQMLLPKNQRDNLKLIYKFKTGRDCQNKRISIKTLKMYENN